MNKQFDNEKKGTLGENLYKEHDKHPDMKGRCTINGVDYNISGWMKQGKTGPFYSLSFSEKQDKKPAEPGSRIIKPKPIADSFGEDEVPF